MRLGSDDIFSNFGISFILIFILLLIIYLVIVCGARVSKRYAMSSKVQEFFRKIEKKLLYNPMIRYSMLNCLKFNYTAIVALIGIKSAEWT